MKKKLLLICASLIMLLTANYVFASSSSDDAKEAAATVSPEPAIGSIQEAMKEFKSLSRHERKGRFKEMKQALKDFKADKKAGKEVSTNTLLQVILAIFIPPLAVYLHEGETNNRFWIDVLLTILGFVLFASLGTFFLGSLPGIIYALIVILAG